MAITPYEPEALPIKDLDYSRIISLVGEANAALARYDGLLQAMVNPAILLSPLTDQEALLSSKIEGTIATMEEVLEFEAGAQEQDQEKIHDIQEIINYRQALRLAQTHLIDRPIRLSLILQLHKTLMNSVRGEDKTPGEFRKNQNWIGRLGRLIEEASFIPPSPLRLMDHLQAWEAYLDYQDFDALAQAAIIHAQFELIHPFKDGNGRIGRLLIPLFLHGKGRLSSPMFYLSGYLDSYRDEYIAHLQDISRERRWTEWIAFFLTAIIEQAKMNTGKVQEIMRLYDSMKERVRDITHSQHSAQVVDALFDRPAFQVGQFSARTNINIQTAHVLVRQLHEEGILTVIRQSSGRRAAIYAFPWLVNIAEGRKVFEEAKDRI